MTAPAFSLCVYCGSRPGVDPAFAETARAIGEWIGSRGGQLVYGGGRNGLMGVVAEATLAAGGRVVGIIPKALVEKEWAHNGCTELHIVENMHECKRIMAEHADAFVALPGGIGTLEELTEISTWAQLDQHAKPIILCNIENYWEPYLTLLKHMRAENFIREGMEFKMDVVKTADDVVPAFEYRLANSHQKVPLEPIRKVL
jgi:uncharacterized protein (TIGR00730 family)